MTNPFITATAAATAAAGAAAITPAATPLAALLPKGILIVSKALHFGQDFINQTKLHHEYSQIFRILLPKSHIATDVKLEGTEKSEDLLKELQNYVTTQIKRERDAMEARIKAFIEKEQTEFIHLEQSAHEDKFVLYRKLVTLRQQEIASAISDAMLDDLVNDLGNDTSKSVGRKNTFPSTNSGKTSRSSSGTVDHLTPLQQPAAQPAASGSSPSPSTTAPEATFPTPPTTSTTSSRSGSVNTPNAPLPTPTSAPTAAAPSPSVPTVQGATPVTSTLLAVASAVAAAATPTPASASYSSSPVAPAVPPSSVASSLATSFNSSAFTAAMASRLSAGLVNQKNAAEGSGSASTDSPRLLNRIAWAPSGSSAHQFGNKAKVSQSVPAHRSDFGGRRSTDYLFDMDGFEEKRDAEDAARRYPDDDNDDVIEEEQEDLPVPVLDDSSLFATSLPVAVPIAPPGSMVDDSLFSRSLSRKRNPGNDADMFGTSPATQERMNDLAASMMELSRQSVNDSTMAFGELPRRKMSTIL